LGKKYADFMFWSGNIECDNVNENILKNRLTNYSATIIIMMVIIEGKGKNIYTVRLG